MSDLVASTEPPVAMPTGLRQIRDGLAICARGAGEPLLLMPYPHGFTAGPITEGTLATLLTGLGRRVVSFDPPGAGPSSRPPRLDMPEMVACATQALDTPHMRDPVDTVGHSMGGLCALALAINHPERVRRLVLVGSGAPDATTRSSRWDAAWSSLAASLARRLSSSSAVGTIRTRRSLPPSRGRWLSSSVRAACKPAVALPRSQSALHPEEE